VFNRALRSALLWSSAACWHDKAIFLDHASPFLGEGTSTQIRQQTYVEGLFASFVAFNLLSKSTRGIVPQKSSSNDRLRRYCVRYLISVVTYFFFKKTVRTSSLLPMRCFVFSAPFRAWHRSMISISDNSAALLTFIDLFRAFCFSFFHLV